MLRQRVITALLMVAVFIPALFHPEPIGLAELSLVLIVAGDGSSRSVLFCRERNAERELWDGYRCGPEAAPGRFTLGLGASSPVIVERWNGIAYDKPYQRTRDTLRFLRSALADAEVVMLLRIQHERQTSSHFPSLGEYTSMFGLNKTRASWLHPKAIIMHPGPINRGVEIDSELADGDRSVILEQVTNGIAIRMAVLYLCSGGQPETVTASSAA